jgi:ABC-type Zn uptake system ZnuABC Zn-binding protein ZnuA
MKIIIILVERCPMANAARSAGAVLLIATLSLLGGARPGLTDRLRVVASHSVLCDLVEQIATDRALTATWLHS